MYVSTVHYSAVKCPWCLWNLHALVKHPCVVLTHQHLHYQPLNLLQEPLEGPASKFVEIDLFPWKSPLRSCTFSEFSNFGCVACCADWLTFHPVYLCHLTDNSGKKLAKKFPLPKWLYPPECRLAPQIYLSQHRQITLSNVLRCLNSENADNHCSQGTF